MAEDFYVFRRSGRDNLYVQFRNSRTGKLGAACSSGKTSEAAAIRWAKNAIRDTAEKKAGRPTSATTLGEWAKPFYGPDCPYLDRKKTDTKRTYSTGYTKTNTTYIKTHILTDPIADLRLDDLRRIDVLAWRKRLVAKIGASRTAGRILQVLKVILNEAVYSELIEYSPASKVEPPSYDSPGRDAIALESIRKMISPTLYADPRHWLATVVAAFTGMRASEIRALQWEALDFGRRLIYVTQAFKDQTKRLGPPKSGKPRVSPMPEGLAKLLLAWRDDTVKQRKAEEGPWVFGYSLTRPLGYRDWNSAVKKAAKAAGCEGATLHYLRHSLNTYLVGAGGR